MLSPHSYKWYYIFNIDVNYIFTRRVINCTLVHLPSIYGDTVSEPRDSGPVTIAVSAIRSTVEDDNATL